MTNDRSLSGVITMKTRPQSAIRLNLTLLCLTSVFGCDGGVSPTEMLEPDIGQVFFEPTLDMSSRPDLGEDEETRILGEFGDSCERNFDCAEQWCIDAGEENI